MQDDDKPDFTPRDIAFHRAFMLFMAVVCLALAFFYFVDLTRPSYFTGTVAIALAGFFLWVFYWLRRW